MAVAVIDDMHRRGLGLLLVQALCWAARRRGIERFTAIVLPGAVPFIITGVRLGITRGLIGIVVGEYLAATEGIGWLLSNATDTFNMVRVFALIIVLAFVGVTLTTIARALERRFDSWRAV